MLEASRLNDNPFIGQKSYFFVEKASIMACKRRNSSANLFFLFCLFGKVAAKLNGSIRRLNIKITEYKDYGPLFINRSRNDFFIFNNTALRKLMDKLGVATLDEFEGKKLPVVNTSKGYWAISLDQAGG